MKRLSLLFLFVVYPMSHAELERHNQPTKAEQVDSLFEGIAADEPGAAAAVVRDGEIIFLNGYGLANLEHAVPITADTVFDIASVSKQFVGFAIASLVEDGLVDPDAEARRYLPELSDFGHPLTVGHLVHHTSGIRDWTGALAAAGWRFDDVISFDQILRMAWSQRELNFDPGAEYRYSNTGYNLMAEIVERVSGQSFATWAEENIFKPLGMENTHVHHDHRRVVKNRATGYREADGSFHTVMNGLTALGSSSQFSSARDMASWLINFDRHDAGGPAVIDRMRTRGILNDGTRISYAYGIGHHVYRGAEAWAHSGSWAGFRTDLIHFPSEKFGVVVLSNRGSFNASRRSRQIADIFLADVFEANEAGNTPPSAPPEQTVVAVDAALLTEYAGTFRLGPAWYLTVAHEGDGLSVQATNEQRFPMTPVSEFEFRVEAYGASILFERNADNRVDHIRYRAIHAPRVEPFDPATLDLSEYAGIFASDELATSYTLAVVDGELRASHYRHGIISFTPAAADEFSSNAWYFSPVSFVRDEEGEVAEFLVGTGRAANLRFRKVGDKAATRL